MSEIQYVTRLGDALDAMAVASAPASGRPSGRRLPRFRSGRSRLLVGLAVVLVSGGVATAATLLSRGPTVLAARGLTCEPGAPGDYTGATLGIEEAAHTPTAACAAVDRVRASKLIACASAKFGVVVYHRDGDPSECADAAMGSLPVGYTAAAKRVATLIRDLNRLQASQNCFTQSSLVAATQSTLNTLGFIGWHARISRPPGDTHPSAWRCAQYPASGLRLSDAASAISYDNSGRSRVVAVVSDRRGGPIVRSRPSADASCTYRLARAAIRSAASSHSCAQPCWPRSVPGRRCDSRPRLNPRARLWASAASHAIPPAARSWSATDLPHRASSRHKSGRRAGRRRTRATACRRAPTSRCCAGPKPQRRARPARSPRARQAPPRGGR